MLPVVIKSTECLYLNAVWSPARPLSLKVERNLNLFFFFITNYTRHETSRKHRNLSLCTPLAEKKMTAPQHSTCIYINLFLPINMYIYANIRGVTVHRSRCLICNSVLGSRFCTSLVHRGQSNKKSQMHNARVIFSSFQQTSSRVIVCSTHCNVYLTYARQETANKHNIFTQGWRRTWQHRVNVFVFGPPICFHMKKTASERQKQVVGFATDTSGWSRPICDRMFDAFPPTYNCWTMETQPVHVPSSQLIWRKQAAHWGCIVSFFLCCCCLMGVEGRHFGALSTTYWIGDWTTKVKLLLVDTCSCDVYGTMTSVEGWLHVPLPHLSSELLFCLH